MTENQKQLLNDLLLDFPEAKRYLEYEDYTANPTVENASELISTIIERNADVIGNRQNFVGYMAMRPGVQKRGSHGLFNEKDEPIILDRVANEIANHKGNVWSHVISLRREDAIRLGYDNSEAWRQLVMRHISDIAKNQKISLCNLKWYAAFHDTTHHPHIHLLVYSENTKEGFLTNEGINKIRSAFANDIFHDDLQSIYQEQTLSRDELKAVSKTEFESVVRKIQQGDFENPQLENFIRKLYSQLQNVKGKKVYVYLPQEGNKFAQYSLANLYYYGNGVEKDLSQAFWWYRKSSEQGQPYASYAVAQMYSKGEYVAENKETAQRYYKAALSGFLELESKDQADDNLYYKLGAMYKNGLGTEIDIPKAIEYFEKSTENMWSTYQLGRLYLFGAEELEKDKEKAVEWLTKSANDGNEYAQNMLDNMAQFENTILANTIFALFANLCKCIEDDYTQKYKSVRHTVDSRLRRMIRQKKQSFGIKDEQSQSYEQS